MLSTFPRRPVDCEPGLWPVSPSWQSARAALAGVAIHRRSGRAGDRASHARRRAESVDQRLAIGPLDRRQLGRVEPRGDRRERARMRQLELEQAAALRPAMVRVAVAAVLIAAGAAFYYFQPERFTNAAQRILLPLVDVEPLYRTTLSVEPGDIEAAGDVELSITIRGERPERTVAARRGRRASASARRSRSTPARPARAACDSRRLHSRGAMPFAAATSRRRFYQITVPTPSHLSLLAAEYHFPRYTGLADKRIESGLRQSRRTARQRSSI